MDSNQTIVQLVGEAAKAHARGNLAEAEELCVEALRLDPKDTQAGLLRGVVMAKTDRWAEALPLLQSVVAADQSSFFARYWLSVVLRHLGRLEEAVSVGRDALRLNPNEFNTLSHVGGCLLDLKRFAEAGPLLSQAARLNPRNAPIREGLGIALQGFGKDAEAENEFRAAMALDSQSPSAALRLGAMLLERQDFAGAEACARKLVVGFPESASAHGLLSRTLMDQGRGLEALEHADRALALGASDASATLTRGTVLQNLGRIEEAEDAFRRAIALDPTNVAAYFALIHNRRLIEADRGLLNKLRDLQHDAAFSAAQKSQIQYALGKGCSDLKEFKEAMGHYDDANRLARSARFGDQPYNRRVHAEGFELVKKAFTREFLSEHLSSNPSDLPIFVVGMMRSGTTLTEQVLSSHSQIGATGEQRFWPERHTKAMVPGRGIDDKVLAELAAEYLAMLRAVTDKGQFLVDKMPVNYSFVGLIHCALPKAKFIHVRRNPVDTCLSIYMTPNRSRIEWAHDKSDLAYAYRQYAGLMEHWARVLPPESLHQVRYEDLVLNREETTRSLLDFCGVEWEDSALRPEENDRAVLTPSVWQVRQPVFSTSIEKWRNYEPWLGALKDLL